MHLNVWKCQWVANIELFIIFKYKIFMKSNRAKLSQSRSKACWWITRPPYLNEVKSCWNSSYTFHWFLRKLGSKCRSLEEKRIPQSISKVNLSFQNTLEIMLSKETQVNRKNSKILIAFSIYRYIIKLNHTLFFVFFLLQTNKPSRHQSQ